MENLYNHYVRDENGNYTRITVEERPSSPLFSADREKMRETPLPSPPMHRREEPHNEPRREEPLHIPHQEGPPHRMPPPEPHHAPHQPPPPPGPPPFPFSQLLGQLHMEDVDGGDLLLLFLLFFLFRRGADEELLIALGLLLIL